MKKVLIVFAAIIVIVVVWLFTLPGEYNIQRSISINAPKAIVLQNVVDFKQWTKWSPWLLMEPSAKITFSGNTGSIGSTYSWTGELVGSGEMEILSIDNDSNQIDYSLRFKDPYESESDVYFNLSEDGESTTILWGMKGKLPFFMRFMTKSMETYIGMDYDRGLLMLKDLSEEGEVFSTITYGDVSMSEATSFIGIKHKVTMNEMGDLMPMDFAELSRFFEENGLETIGAPMTVYYTMDFETGITEFATAFPINDETIKVPENFFIGKLPETKTLQVTHHGKYQHIGNAWSAAIQYARTHKLKANLNATSWEVYTNDPNKVGSAKDYETVVYLPLK